MRLGLTPDRHVPLAPTSEANLCWLLIDEFGFFRIFRHQSIIIATGRHSYFHGRWGGGLVVRGWMVLAIFSASSFSLRGGAVPVTPKYMGGGGVVQTKANGSGFRCRCIYPLLLVACCHFFHRALVIGIEKNEQKLNLQNLNKTNKAHASRNSGAVSTQNTQVLLQDTSYYFCMKKQQIMLLLGCAFASTLMYRKGVAWPPEWIKGTQTHAHTHVIILTHACKQAVGQTAANGAFSFF